MNQSRLWKWHYPILFLPSKQRTREAITKWIVSLKISSQFKQQIHGHFHASTCWSIGQPTRTMAMCELSCYCFGRQVPFLPRNSETSQEVTKRGNGTKGMDWTCISAYRLISSKYFNTRTLTNNDYAICDFGFWFDPRRSRWRARQEFRKIIASWSRGW